MGTPAFAAVCLKRLLGGPHEVAVVVTRADRPAGRGHKLRASAVKELATVRGIELLQPVALGDEDFVARFRAAAVDLAVVVAYGRMLPEQIITAPRLGCINAHASLLPLLRGAAPIERAILEGHEETGVTIIRINERMDAGDMLASRSVAIAADTDSGSLREALAAISADLLVRAVDDLASGRARFVRQDERQATYAPPLATEEAHIDWSRAAVDVDRQVRAFRPRPGAFTFHDGLRLKVLSGRAADESSDAAPASIVASEGDGLAVACGSGVFVIERVQPAGRRAMSASDYARGRSGAGKRLG